MAAALRAGDGRFPGKTFNSFRSIRIFSIDVPKVDIHNSLVSKYTPRRRRSWGYGLSFTMTFGLGGFGAALAGYLAEDWQKYGALAALAASATVCGVGLWWRNCQ